MKYPILDFKEELYFKEFVKFWKKLYLYPFEDIYLNRINKNTFTKGDIEKLFTWKNGMKFSQKKLKTIKKLKNKIDTINNLKREMNLEIFKSQFSDISTIWKIYLLHIINPSKYPIFDQHVFRAFIFLKTGNIREIPSSNKKKEKIYFEEYLPFFDSLNKKELSTKEIDEALWAFGKFLKTNYAHIISS